MGATVGCIVPLAERSVGEILGFAASVVVGLTDSGLRALGVNTLGGQVVNLPVAEALGMVHHPLADALTGVPAPS